MCLEKKTSSCTFHFIAKIWILDENPGWKSSPNLKISLHCEFNLFIYKHFYSAQFLKHQLFFIKEKSFINEYHVIYLLMRNKMESNNGTKFNSSKIIQKWYLYKFYMYIVCFPFQLMELHNMITRNRGRQICKVKVQKQISRDIAHIQQRRWNRKIWST